MMSIKNLIFSPLLLFFVCLFLFIGLFSENIKEKTYSSKNLDYLSNESSVDSDFNNSKERIEEEPFPENSNEIDLNSLYLRNNSLQFYPNMRFPSKYISYKIYECSDEQTNKMENAFLILENYSILEFYPVKDNEEISVSCNNEKRTIGKFIIAGEGGPTEIISSGNFGKKI